MASRSHLMIDALQHLADPDRYAQSASDQRAAVAARHRAAGPAEPPRSVRRYAAILAAVAAPVVASVAVLIAGSAG
jgi:hypothetical protein